MYLYIENGATVFFNVITERDRQPVTFNCVVDARSSFAMASSHSFSDDMCTATVPGKPRASGMTACPGLSFFKSGFKFKFLNFNFKF